MELMTAISTRRSNGQVTGEPVARDLVEKLLAAASWAPNHHRTEPWRFAVFSGEGRVVLAEAIARGAYQAAEHEGEAACQEKADKATRKVYRAPTVIAVWCAAGRSQAKTPPLWEEHAAVAAALQNMALAAHDLGLAGIWRSGAPCTYPTVHKLLGVEVARGDMVAGFFYVGHPDTGRPEPMRPLPKWEQRTVWYDKAPELPS